MRVPTILLAGLLLGAAGEAPQDFITRYCGGGVTGGGGGLSVTADGTVTRLRRPRAGAPVEETVVRHDPAAYARIGALLDAARFDRMPRGEPSNMTCSITRRRGGQPHVVMWGIGRAPPALSEAFSALEALGRPD